MRQSFRNQKELSQAAKQEKEQEQAWHSIRNNLMDSNSENASEILANTRDSLNDRSKIQKYEFN